MNRFYNIFSQSKKPEKKMLPISVDHREKQSLVITELKSRRVPVVFEQRVFGDYQVNNIVIERKTIKDFALSIKNKRLFNQIDALAKHDAKALIIEGFEEHHLIKSSGLHENAVRGVFAWITITKQIPVFYSYNERDTAQYLLRLASVSSQSQKARPKKKQVSVYDQAVFVLEGFVGIGPSKARRLLHQCGSIQTIMNAPLETLEKIIGTAAKRMIEVRENANPQNEVGLQMDQTKDFQDTP